MVSRIYGNKHHLSDVLTSYAIGIGWGYSWRCCARQPTWALLPISDSHATVGLVFQPVSNMVAARSGEGYDSSLA